MSEKPGQNPQSTLEPALQTILKARSPKEAELEIGKLIREGGPVHEAIFFALRKKQMDGDEEAENILLSVKTVLAKKLQKLHQEAMEGVSHHEPIGNLQGYTYVVTYHAICAVLEERYPRRHHLQEGLWKHFSERRARDPVSADLWEALFRWKEKNEKTEWLTGLGKWAIRGDAPWPEEPLHALLEDAEAAFACEEALQCLEPTYASMDLVETRRIRSIRYDRMLARLFCYAKRPVPFSGLVTIVVNLLRLKEDRTESLEEEKYKLAPPADPKSLRGGENDGSDYAQGVRLWWQELCRLPINQRRAFLLNWRGERRENLLENLIEAGISAQEIAEALEMGRSEFRAVLPALPMEDELLRERYIPGATRQQVIDLRRSAIRRLERRRENNHELAAFAMARRGGQ